MEKKAFEFSFAWIFAIIVGVVIIFIAIFVAMNLIDQGEYEITTETAQSILNTFEYIQTQSEESKVDRLQILKQTRVFTECSVAGDFGKSIMRISEISGFSGDWSKKSSEVSANNQYIFSENHIEVEKQGEIYFFVMPFKMPFKVADISIIHSKQYCFVNPNSKIKNKVEDMSLDNKNILVVKEVSECEEQSIKVCFENNRECEVIVDINEQTVSKDNEELYYVDNLMYAAIFSSPENYECVVNRLIKKTEILADVYYDKSVFLSVRGCNTGLENEIKQLESLSKN